MALTVRTNTTSAALTAKTTAAPRINSTVSRIDFDLVNIEELNNVDITEGLGDGYTLVYDVNTQKWIAQLTEGIGNIDGGTY